LLDVTHSKADEADQVGKEIEDLLARRDRLVEAHLENPKAIPLDVLEKKQAELEHSFRARRRICAPLAGTMAKSLTDSRRLASFFNGPQAAIARSPTGRVELGIGFLSTGCSSGTKA
jgi:hypothetical protein